MTECLRSLRRKYEKLEVKYTLTLERLERLQASCVANEIIIEMKGNRR